METNPGVILQRMGVEMSPDDPRSAEQILHEINRSRIESNIVMEPDPEIKARMGAFALHTYPLEADRGILSGNE